MLVPMSMLHIAMKNSLIFAMLPGPASGLNGTEALQQALDSKAAAMTGPMISPLS
jgi:hypothetical protein